MNNKYYIQDSRYFLGNTVVWLADDGNYTVDLRKAKICSKEEADKILEERPSDIAWPTHYIDRKTQPTVDVRHIERRESQRAMKIPLVYIPKCSHCDDIINEATCAETQCERWKGLQTS